MFFLDIHVQGKCFMFLKGKHHACVARTGSKIGLVDPRGIDRRSKTFCTTGPTIGRDCCDIQLMCPVVPRAPVSHVMRLHAAAMMETMPARQGSPRAPPVNTRASLPISGAHMEETSGYIESARMAPAEGCSPTTKFRVKRWCT